MKIYAVVGVAALCGIVYQIELEHRATLAGRADNLHIGMTEAEIRRIMGRPPDNWWPAWAPSEGQRWDEVPILGNWIDQDWTVTLTTDFQGTLTKAPDVQCHRLPWWRRMLDWMRARLGW